VGVHLGPLGQTDLPGDESREVLASVVAIHALFLPDPEGLVGGYDHPSGIVRRLATGVPDLQEGYFNQEPADLCLIAPKRKPREETTREQLPSFR
jgi:hypothetical protein